MSRSTVYGLRSFLRLNINHLSSALSIFQGFHWQRLKDIIAIWFLAMVAVMTFRYNFAFFVQERFSLSNSDLGWISSYSGVMAVCTSTLCGGVSNRYVNFSRHPVPALFLLLLCLVSAALSANVSQILLSHVSPLPLYSLPTDMPARLDAGEGEAGREGCYSRVHVFDIVSLSHDLPESGGRGTGVWRASVCVSGGRVCCVSFSWDGLCKGQLEMRFVLLQCYTMYKQSSNLAVGKGERSVSTVE